MYHAKGGSVFFKITDTKAGETRTAAPPISRAKGASAHLGKEMKHTQFKESDSRIQLNTHRTSVVVYVKRGQVHGG